MGEGKRAGEEEKASGLESRRLSCWTLVLSGTEGLSVPLLVRNPREKRTGRLTVRYL